MKPQGSAQAVAVGMPSYLRSLRGQAALSPSCRVMGIEEVECPACGGSGWQCRQALRCCPVCCGFCEVPEAVALWFEGQTGLDRHGMPYPRPALGVHHAFRRTQRPYGRTAEVLYRVSLEAAHVLLD